MKKLLSIIFLLFSSIANGQSVQQSGQVTPGHISTWITDGVIGDGGIPGGPIFTGATTLNDFACVGTSGTIIDCGLSAVNTNAWTGLQNFNGGATAPTRSPGDSTTNVATTAFVGANSLIVGTSIITGGTPNGILFDNAGVLGNSTSLPSVVSVACSNLPAGSDCNAFNSQTANYSLLAADCGKTLVLTGNTFFTLTVGAASGFASTCTVNIVNADAAPGSGGRGKKMTISGLTLRSGNGNIIYPGESFTLKNENNVWVPFGLPTFYRLPGSTAFYADSTSGSDSGSTDCLATGASACLTVTHAAAVYCQYIIKNGQAFTIQMPMGFNQVENVVLCPFTSDEILAQATAPTITGAAIVPTSGQAVTAVNVNTPWKLLNISISVANTSTTAVESDINSLIYVEGVTFFTCGICMQSVSGGKIELNGAGVNLNTNVAIVATASTLGQFITNGRPVNCTGIAAVTTFAQAASNGLMNWAGTTFPGCGSVTGNRDTEDTGGGIFTGTSGTVTFFPGNSRTGPTSPGWFN